MYKVPEFKISDFVESLPIKVKFLNPADSRPKHPDNAACLCNDSTVFNAKTDFWLPFELLRN